MHYASIANVLGKLLIVTGSSMALPWLCSLYYKEGDHAALLISALISIGIGLILWWIFRRDQEPEVKACCLASFNCEP
jgi:Trk-type K+ transport system membrane component